MEMLNKAIIASSKPTTAPEASGFIETLLSEILISTFRKGLKELNSAVSEFEKDAATFNRYRGLVAPYMGPDDNLKYYMNKALESHEKAWVHFSYLMEMVVACELSISVANSDEPMVPLINEFGEYWRRDTVAFNSMLEQPNKEIQS